MFSARLKNLLLFLSISLIVTNPLPVKTIPPVVALAAMIPLGPVAAPVVLASGQIFLAIQNAISNICFRKKSHQKNIFIKKHTQESSSNFDTVEKTAQIQEIKPQE